jgi:hypothetical protein
MHIHARHMHPLLAAARSQHSRDSRQPSPGAPSGEVGGGLPGGWLPW